MRRLIRLRDDCAGASAIEIAIALPVLVLFIYGFFTLGLLYQANAGMQHALGEGARFATLYVEENDGPPDEDDILGRIASAEFGLRGGSLSPPQIDNSTAASGFITISLTYSRPTNFLFFTGPTVTLTQSKRVYIAA